MSKLLGSVKDRAKKKRLQFSIDFEWLMEQFTKQNGCCALTNIKLEFSKIDKHKNPYSPSIDQIIPHKGYTKDNCRLVCVAINLGMNEFGTEVFKIIANAFIDNEKEKEKENAKK